MAKTGTRPREAETPEGGAVDWRAWETMTTALEKYRPGKGDRECRNARNDSVVRRAGTSGGRGRKPYTHFL